MFVGVLDFGLAREMPVSYGRKDFDFRIEGSSADFDSDLILTFSSTAVRNSYRAFFVGDVNESFSD